MQSNASCPTANPPSPTRINGFCLPSHLRTWRTIWEAQSSVVLCRRLCCSSHFLEYSKTLRNGRANALGMKGNLTDKVIVSHLSPDALTSWDLEERTASR